MKWRQTVNNCMDKEEKRELLKKVKSFKNLVENATSYKELLLYRRLINKMERELMEKYPERFGIELV